MAPHPGNVSFVPQGNARYTKSRNPAGKQNPETHFREEPKNL